jgi:hypothetical protein
LLDSCQIQELGNTVIGGTHHFFKGFGINGDVAYGFKTVLGKEVHLKGEAEHALDANALGTFQKRGNDGVPHALTSGSLGYNQGTNLRQVFPHHVKCAGTNDGTGFVQGNQKLWHLFKEPNQVVVQ